jgi:taurine dioxygenase
MSKLTIRDIEDDLPFGAIIDGVSLGNLRNADVRAEINDTFERRGLIVFTGCPSTAQFQIDLSAVFGPLKDHPTTTTARVDKLDPNYAPGVIDMHYVPPSEPSDVGLIEINGRKIARWSNWHFDHCYNDELNLAGVLRSIIIPPEGGMTGFIDGVEMYNKLPVELRNRIEACNVIYTLDVRRSKMRFGVPKGFKAHADSEYVMNNVREGLSFPRAMHPAVWTRRSGEKVLHISPWMAVGIEANETPEGDTLLEDVCQAMIALATPYWHKWEPDHMVIWDNRRVLHAVSGSDPKYERRMQRTTIRGDYGLGYFEDGKKIGEVQREFAV